MLYACGGGGRQGLGILTVFHLIKVGIPVNLNCGCVLNSFSGFFHLKQRQRRVNTFWVDKPLNIISFCTYCTSDYQIFIYNLTYSGLSPTLQKMNIEPSGAFGKLFFMTGSARKVKQTL